MIVRRFDDKDPSSFPGHADYELVKKMRGFAYYVVEHDGKPALKKIPYINLFKKKTLEACRW